MARSAVSGRVPVANRQLIRDTGTCLLFGNASTDRILVPTSTSLSLNGAFTFACWINPRSMSAGNPRIFEKSGAYFFQLNNAAGNRFGVSVNGGGSVFSNNSVLSIGLWQHIA